MGTVFDAVDREHGTRVALKTLNHLSATTLLRFKSEFRSVADLSHPNLVSLYELSCHDDLWFFTMEPVQGVDFVTRLRGEPIREMPTLEELAEPTVRARAGPGAARARDVDLGPSMPRALADLRDAFGQLVRGVRALHGAGLLHLDIKPSNVLVDRSGRVVVLDFGLVRGIDEERSPAADPGSISGTPTWMAPEQHIGEGIGPATDWYAVGLMLYLTLTGVPAFAPASIELLSYAKHHSTPTDPAKLLPDLPEDLCVLATALLRVDPSSRPTGDTLAALFGEETASLAPAPRVRARLVGRDVERTRLRETFHRVRAAARST
jgi:serine/threonine protein kinase